MSNEYCTVPQSLSYTVVIGSSSRELLLRFTPAVLVRSLHRTRRWRAGEYSLDTREDTLADLLVELLAHDTYRKNLETKKRRTHPIKWRILGVPVHEKNRIDHDNCNKTEISTATL